MNSPLQLSRLVFTKVHVDSSTPTIEGNSEIMTSATLGANLDNKNDRHSLLKLLVRFGPAEGKPNVYSGELEVVGEFLVAPEYPLEKAPLLAFVNGASILYGAVREMVTNITARSPLGIPLVLSSMSFTDVAEKALADIKKQRAQREAVKVEVSVTEH
jgi:preprotein translocase subunit SecB